MANFTVHLAIAQEWARLHNKFYSDDFMYGAVAPDLLAKINNLQGNFHYGIATKDMPIVLQYKNKVDLHKYVMQNDISSTNGLWVMKTFLGYLGLDSNYAQFYELQHPTSFNTFGYVIYFFKDFGFIGSLIASYILGVIINKLYAAYQTSTSPFLAVVYLFNFRAVMMMFFNNHWCTGAYPITIAVLMLISTIVYKSVPFMGEIPEKREELY